MGKYAEDSDPIHAYPADAARGDIRSTNDLERDGEDKECGLVANPESALCFESSGVLGQKTLANVVNWISNDCLLKGWIHHGFLSLFLSGVPVTLGNDGGPVEHAEHFQDFMFVDALITHFVDVCFNNVEPKTWDYKDLCRKWNDAPEKRCPDDPEKRCPEKRLKREKIKVGTILEYQEEAAQFTFAGGVPGSNAAFVE